MRYLKLCVYMYERLRLHSKVQFSHVARRGKIQLGKSKKTFEKNIRRKKTFDEKNIRRKNQSKTKTNLLRSQRATCQRNRKKPCSRPSISINQVRMKLQKMHLLFRPVHPLKVRKRIYHLNNRQILSALLRLHLQKCHNQPL